MDGRGERVGHDVFEDLPGSFQRLGWFPRAPMMVANQAGRGRRSAGRVSRQSRLMAVPRPKRRARIHVRRRGRPGAGRRPWRGLWRSSSCTLAAPDFGSGVGHRPWVDLDPEAFDRVVFDGVPEGPLSSVRVTMLTPGSVEGETAQGGEAADLAGDIDGDHVRFRQGGDVDDASKVMKAPVPPKPNNNLVLNVGTNRSVRSSGSRARTQVVRSGRRALRSATKPQCGWRSHDLPTLNTQGLPHHVFEQTCFLGRSNRASSSRASSRPYSYRAHRLQTRRGCLSLPR